MCNHSFIEFPTYWVCQNCGRVSQKQTYTQCLDRLEKLYERYEALIDTLPEQAQAGIQKLDAIVAKIELEFDKKEG